MNKPLLLLLVAIYMLVIPIQGSQSSAQPLFVITEDQIDLAPNGANFGDCLLVRANGSVYLKRRLQPRIGAPVKVGFYETVLGPEQLNQLRSLLNGEAIRSLAAYTEPGIPATVFRRHDIEVEIWRKTGTQRAGYSDWESHVLGSSREDAPPKIRHAQKRAEMALKPLVGWFHGIEAMKLSPSAADNTQCSL